MSTAKFISEGPELRRTVSGPKVRIPDPTFKARMAYARAIRRGSRKHVSQDAFKDSIREAMSVVKPATQVKK